MIAMDKGPAKVQHASVRPVAEHAERYSLSETASIV